MKLPKQFYHWLEQCRIKPLSNKRHSKYNFKGWGTHFRVSPDTFEVINPHLRFDIPKSQQELDFILDEYFRSLTNGTDH